MKDNLLETAMYACGISLAVVFSVSAISVCARFIYWMWWEL